MTFFFGTYGFSIKSFSANELGLEEMWLDSTFEIRQKVFHIFWIPIFPVNRKYVWRYKGDYFDVPSSVKEKLVEKRVRTPWYSFFAPVLILAFSIGVYLLNIGGTLLYEWSEPYKENGKNKEYKEAIKMNLNGFENLQKGAYVKIENYRNPNDDNMAYYLKFLGTKDNLLTFQKYETIIPQNHTDSYGLKKSDIPPIHITKSDLLKAICKNLKTYRSQEGCGFEFFGDGWKYAVTQIDFFDEPVIKGNLGSDFWKINRRNSSARVTNLDDDSIYNKQMNIELNNFGVAGELIDIQNLENHIEWTDNLPLKLETYQITNYGHKSVTIHGKIKKEDRESFYFESLLTVKDSLGHNHQFILQGRNYHYKVWRREKIRQPK